MKVVENFQDPKVRNLNPKELINRSPTYPSNQQKKSKTVKSTCITTTRLFLGGGIPLFTLTSFGCADPGWQDGFRLGVLMLAALGSLLMFPRALRGVTRLVLSVSFRGFKGLALFCFNPNDFSPWFSLFRFPKALRGVTKFSSTPLPGLKPKIRNNSH